MADLQDVANAAVRNMVNNMGFSSGPMIGVNYDRLAPGESVDTLHPLKVFKLASNGGFGLEGSKLLEFYQPDSHVQELAFVLDNFTKMADDVTGIPRYIGGNEKVGGAGRTATGLSMLMQAASNTLKTVINNIDDGIIVPILERTYMYMLQHEPTMAMRRTDAKITPRGANKLAVKDVMAVRRNEFLVSTNNPVDNMLVGNVVRYEMLAQQAKELGFIMPTVRERFVEGMEPGMPQGPAAGAPANPMAQYGSETDDTGVPDLGGNPGNPEPETGSQLLNGHPVVDNTGNM
jgi:hypothetical protein